MTLHGLAQYVGPLEVGLGHEEARQHVLGQKVLPRLHLQRLVCPPPSVPSFALSGKTNDSPTGAPILLT